MGIIISIFVFFVLKVELRYLVVMCMVIFLASIAIFIAAIVLIFIYRYPSSGDTCTSSALPSRGLFLKVIGDIILYIIGGCVVIICLIIGSKC
jgi:hypothetical protein